MGHQFGATHTFNATTGSCGPQRTGSTAYEPGTGSTIMGYRFACGAEDLMSSDTYFHLASLEQIVSYTNLGSGSSCPVITANGNSAPVVDAGPTYTIPQGTPFTLGALGSDANGDDLTSVGKNSIWVQLHHPALTMAAGQSFVRLRPSAARRARFRASAIS
jgi:hypothetical protein